MNNQTRFLGIDFGHKRIGIAISDPLNIIARSMCVIENNSCTIEKLRKIIGDYKIHTIVVGLPLTLKGTKSQVSANVEKFIEMLKNNFDVNIIQWDERFSSIQAQHSMRALGLKKKQRQSKTLANEIAAAIILQSYLDKYNLGIR